MELEKFVLAIAGGLIGFLSASGMETIKRRLDSKKHKEKVNRLIEILYEEIEQIAELLEVDLSIIENNDPDYFLEFGKGGNKYDGKITSIIARLQNNRIIFESHASKLLDLPDYLPNSLARFHNRLQVNCTKMLDAVADGDETVLHEYRSISISEVQALKHDLKVAMQ